MSQCTDHDNRGRTRHLQKMRPPSTPAHLGRVAGRDAQIAALARRVAAVEAVVFARHPPHTPTADAPPDAPRPDAPIPDAPAPALPALGTSADAVAAGVDALRRWTGRASARLVFDDAAAGLTSDALFRCVRGVAGLAYVAVTMDGDVFGGYSGVAVDERERACGDPGLFLFAFEAHGRCETPRRFVVKGAVRGEAAVRLGGVDDDELVTFGVGEWGELALGAGGSYCVSLGDAFEGLKNTLLVRQNVDVVRDVGEFEVARLLVFRLA